MVCHNASFIPEFLRMAKVAILIKNEKAFSSK